LPRFWLIKVIEIFTCVRKHRPIGMTCTIQLIKMFYLCRHFVLFFFSLPDNWPQVRQFVIKGKAKSVRYGIKNNLNYVIGNIDNTLPWQFGRLPTLKAIAWNS